jgi:drug/metabolite transporter superfamily protein YnfA
VLVLVGLVWTAQGVGWLEGSPMTGVTLWAVIGPVVALVGVALVVLGARNR